MKGKHIQVWRSQIALKHTYEFRNPMYMHSLVAKSKFHIFTWKVGMLYSNTLETLHNNLEYT